MYSTRFSSVTVHPGSRLNDLIVNKINRGAGPEQDQSDQDRTTNNSIVTLTGNTIINGSFMFTSGEFWLQNYTFTVNGEAEINGKLYMNNSGSKLSVMNSLIWHSSNSVLSAGNIELQNGLVIESGSVFQMGAGMNISFVGVSSAPDDIIDIGPGANYAQVFIGAPNTRFGNLIINKVDNSYGISDLTIMGNNVLTVLGNMTIDGETWLTLDEISMIVNGNLTKNAALDLRNSSSLEIQGNVVNSDGALGIFENSLMDCQGSFDHPLGTEMEIDSYGCLRLSRPYAGIYQSFAGHIAIYETGSLEILNNGLQIGTDNILLQGGTIKVGWSFRAMNPNTFTGGNGRIEMIGARFSDLQMHSSNRFNDLVINKPGIGFDVVLSTGIDIQRDLIIQGGNLMPMSQMLRVLRDLRIEGGRLSMSSDSVIQVARNWVNTVGSSGFSSGSGGSVSFIDTGNLNSIIPSENFFHLTIAKAAGRHAEISTGATVSVRGTLNIAFRKLIVNPGVTIKLNNNGTLQIGNLGELYAVGSSAQPITFTADSGYYSFQNFSGAKISARHCVFERMNSSGITISSGVVVDTDHPFSNCSFRNGAAGGTLLRKLNNQNLVMTDPVFPSNTWSGAYNVYHEPGAGTLQINNATGAFAGAAFENDPGNRISWTTVYTNPFVAHSPIPADNASGVSTSTMLGWTYSSVSGYPDPIGYIIKISTLPAMTVFNESYHVGGPGTHIITPPISLVIGTTYYWQIIPTTLPQGRFDDGRGAATNCPIWSFSVNDPIISSFPYYEDFESGPGGWYGGAISGPNIWEWGSSSVFGTVSDNYIWATYLDQDYPNNANSWLRSPRFNFSGISQPNFSVWLNIRTEQNYDGMILEYSTDGSTWVKVLGNPGFYNNESTLGPLGANKWSGEINSWAQYSTAIPALANQPQAYLRFRFASDVSVFRAGIGVEDIEIWDGGAGSFAWSETFTGVSIGSIPTGWTRSHNNWSVTQSIQAGGAAPEMQFNWSPEVVGNIYLKTLALDTTGESSLDLSFRFRLDHYSGPYTLKLLSIVGATEHVLREWINPSASIPPQIVSHTITAAQGAGASNLQLAWVFSGNSYNLDFWYIDDIHLESSAGAESSPGHASSPSPYNGATDVALNTIFSWAYNTQHGHPDPTGYRFRLGTSPTMSSFTERYIAGGPGFHTYESDILLESGSTYYWQVIPTTGSRAESSDFGLASDGYSRSDAQNCPIWTFETLPDLPIAVFPYLEGFESGPGRWTSGAISGNDHWELGYPSQDNITGPYSGGNAWMTYLAANYENNANCWLKSPAFNFSELSFPNFSVWLNIYTENNWDGMVLEYSTDDVSWTRLVRDDGFYNNVSPSGPLAPPKWSGQVGAWAKYSTTLSELAHEPAVWLRFRFQSDNSVQSEGIAIDDVRIWQELPAPAHAHSPGPADTAIDIPLQTALSWTYTSQPGHSDPVVYYVKAGTDPTLTSSQSTVYWAGPGNHSILPPLDLQLGQTYYWQVIPSANPEAYRERSRPFENLPELLSTAKSQARDTAFDSPIWSFTTIADSIPIAVFPYFEDFEADQGGWKSGRSAGLNIWQYGPPGQTYLNSAYSGSNAWMTGLTTNYLNNSNIWLRSPLFDFSELSDPMFSVWLNFKTEMLYDGMVLEASTDGGYNYYPVNADPDFYNDLSGTSPLSIPKWSGTSVGWLQFSTSLPGLANQSSVRLRFRFVSDVSNVDEGFAIDDIRVWNRETAAFAINPTTHDFGRIELGSSSALQQFEISNNGAGIMQLDPANISIIGLNPDEFQLSNLSAPIALNSGESVSLSISFSPLTVGAKTATLSITEGSARSSAGLRQGNSQPTRNLHLIPLSGFGFELITMNVPYYEGFADVASASLPAGWESSNPNWTVSDNSQAGGDIPELWFSFDPRHDGEVTLLSPLFDTGGLSQIDLTFKHRVHHLDNAFDLKLYTVVGAQYRLIDEWLNVDSDILSETISYQLTSANHGVGANNLRLAFVFSGDSYNITGWHSIRRGI